MLQRLFDCYLGTAEKLQEAQVLDKMTHQSKIFEQKRISLYGDRTIDVG